MDYYCTFCHSNVFEWRSIVCRTTKIKDRDTANDKGQKKMTRTNQKSRQTTQPVKSAGKRG